MGSMIKQIFGGAVQSAARYESDTSSHPRTSPIFGVSETILIVIWSAPRGVFLCRLSPFVFPLVVFLFFSVFVLLHGMKDQPFDREGPQILTANQRIAIHQAQEPGM